MSVLERMVQAVERVRQRLRRASQALERGQVPYAVVGGNAVAAWVASIDEGAVRNTQDVDVLIRRDDLEKAKEAMATEGFVFRHAAGVDMFLDGPQAKARDAVHIVFAGEKVRPDYAEPSPSVEEAERLGEVTVLSLVALVRMKLTSFRDKDRTHLRDLIEVGLVGEDWPSRLPPSLGARLQAILDDPDG
ncbi:MAG: nucleotidyltransferase family protein [Vulcanimicrobiota bacterium]